MLLCNADILSHNKLGMGVEEINAIFFISNGREQPQFGSVNVKA